MNHALRMKAFADADLYLVVTEAHCAGRSPVAVLEDALVAGVRLVQLREKNLSDELLYRRALQFRELTARKQALLIIDDRVDIALATGADGVHVGQDDLPVEAVKRLGPDLIVGCSTHSELEAVAAQKAGASYVNIGPIFPTRTKEGVPAGLGPEAIDRIKRHLTIPWTVMGGIKPCNVGLVLQRGAERVGVVTAITAADDVTTACEELRGRIREARERAVRLREYYLDAVSGVGACCPTTAVHQPG
jgi:thiamine-phosphate pyrophosphorylase